LEEETKEDQPPEKKLKLKKKALSDASSDFSEGSDSSTGLS